MGEFRKPWTADMDAQLRDLIGRGLSGSQVGKIMGMTRSAIIGRKCRLKIETPVSLRTEQHREAGVRSGAARRAKAAQTPPPKPAPPEAPKPVGPMLMIPLLSLEHHHCRWPVTTGANALFCGRHKASGSYCAEHAAVAYLPPKTSTRDLIRMARRAA